MTKFRGSGLINEKLVVFKEEKSRKGKKGLRVWSHHRGLNVHDSVAQDIVDSMDPTKGSGECETVADNSKPAGVRDDGYIDLQYRAVVARTEKAVRLGIKGKQVWFAKSYIEFLPNCFVRIPYWAAYKHGLI